MKEYVEASSGTDRNFEAGQMELARKLRDGPKWPCGQILEKSGPISLSPRERHTDQLLYVSGEESLRPAHEGVDNSLPTR